MSEPKRPEDIFVGKSHKEWLDIGNERGWLTGSNNSEVMGIIAEQASEIHRLRSENSGQTLTRSRIDEALKEMEENTLLIDGFDEAFLGFSQRINQPILAVYSYDGLVKVCMDRDGMEWEEAVEYVDYNIVGAWVGEQTPIIVMPLADY